MAPIVSLSWGNADYIGNTSAASDGHIKQTGLFQI